MNYNKVKLFIHHVGNKEREEEEDEEEEEEEEENVFTEEICHDDDFHAVCEDDGSLEIINAMYGRNKIGKCIRKDYGKSTD